MERRDIRHIPTEDLVTWMVFSWFDKTKYSYYPELGRRFIIGSMVSVAVASNMLIAASAAGSREIVRGFS